MNPPTIQTPFLPTSRVFPDNYVELEPHLTKMYIDVAQAVNSRVIGIYDKFQVVTGERWFNDLDPQKKRQTYRQVYSVPSILNGTTSIPLNFTVDANTNFTHIYGAANSVSAGFSVPIEHINVAAPADSISIRINRTTSTIEIITTTANWTTYSAIIVVEYLLN